MEKHTLKQHDLLIPSYSSWTDRRCSQILILLINDEKPRYFCYWQNQFDKTHDSSLILAMLLCLLTSNSSLNIQFSHTLYISSISGDPNTSTRILHYLIWIPWQI